MEAPRGAAGAAAALLPLPAAVSASSAGSSSSSSFSSSSLWAGGPLHGFPGVKFTQPPAPEWRCDACRHVNDWELPGCALCGRRKFAALRAVELPRGTARTDAPTSIALAAAGAPRASPFQAPIVFADPEAGTPGAPRGARAGHAALAAGGYSAAPVPPAVSSLAAGVVSSTVAALLGPEDNRALEASLGSSLPGAAAAAAGAAAAEATRSAEALAADVLKALPKPHPEDVDWERVTDPAVLKGVLARLQVQMLRLDPSGALTLAAAASAAAAVQAAATDVAAVLPGAGPTPIPGGGPPLAPSLIANAHHIYNRAGAVASAQAAAMASASGGASSGAGRAGEEDGGAGAGFGEEARVVSGGAGGFGGGVRRPGVSPERAAAAALPPAAVAPTAAAVVAAPASNAMEAGVGEEEGVASSSSSSSGVGPGEGDGAEGEGDDGDAAMEGGAGAAATVHAGAGGAGMVDDGEPEL